MITLTKYVRVAGQDPPPLTWRMVWANQARTQKSAIITCGNGHDGALNHSIAADGAVSPSCVCTVDGCGWHEWGRLADWEP